MDDSAQILERALRGEPTAVRLFVDKVTPVIQSRVARRLFRRGAAQGRNIRQELEDMSQEVFLSLFADNGRALRAWDPARGLSLENFIGLLAEHQVTSIMRSGRRNPWTEEPWETGALDLGDNNKASPELRAASSEMLSILMDRVKEKLSPRGLQLFHLLILEERPIDAVCADFGMQPDAVYAWRSRLVKLVRSIAADLENRASVSDLPRG